MRRPRGARCGGPGATLEQRERLFQRALRFRAIAVGRRCRGIGQLRQQVGVAGRMQLCHVIHGLNEISPLVYGDVSVEDGCDGAITTDALSPHDCTMVSVNT